MPAATAVTFTSADGEVLDFSTTAKDPARRVTIEEVTTKEGTGFENAIVRFDRDPTLRYDDMQLLERMRIEGASGRVLFDGAVTGRVPEGSLEQVSATGDFSLLKDKAGYSEIFRDQDSGNWREASVDRKVNLAASSISDNSPINDGGYIRTELGKPPWSAAGLPRSTAVYVSPAGAPIGRVEGDWVRGVDAIHTDATYKWAAYLSENEFFTGSPDTTGDLQAAGPGTFGLDASTETRRYAELFLEFAASYGSGDSNDRSIAWKPVVYGKHGLTTITPSTVLRHALARYQPAIKFDDESIADHNFEIGQLLFEATDLASVAATVNAYANWDFGVWEDSKFWFQPQPLLSRPHYILDPSGLDKEGRSISTDYPVNGVEVFFKDVLTGRTERLGPSDDWRLRDESESNPCNRQLRDRWGKLDIPFVCDEDTAIQIGSVWLAEHLIPSRNGEGRAIGKVLTSSGQLVPASEIRSGDVVRYWHETIGRKVYSSRWSPGDQVNKLTYSDAAATLDAILERIGVRIMLISGKGL